MVELSRLERVLKTVHNPGYSSIYSFDESAAIEIIESKCSRGFDKYVAYSDQLVIDLDDGDATLPDVEAKLVELGYKYDLYSSGGKGYHIILFHELIGSPDLPWSQLRFVDNLGFKCDRSLYQHGRILSLPGRVHEKTKQRKRLLKQVSGSLIEFPLVARPTITPVFEGLCGLDSLQGGLASLIGMSMCEPDIGNRHMSFWTVARDLLRAGLKPETILDVLLRINETWRNKKPPEEVENAVRQACH
jgi:hypothetical protein